MAGLVGTRDSALGRLFHDQPWGSSSARQRSRCHDAASQSSPPRRGGKQGYCFLSCGDSIRETRTGVKGREDLEEAGCCFRQKGSSELKEQRAPQGLRRGREGV